MREIRGLTVSRGGRSSRIKRVSPRRELYWSMTFYGISSSVTLTRVVPYDGADLSRPVSVTGRVIPATATSRGPPGRTRAAPLDRRPRSPGFATRQGVGHKEGQRQ